MASRHQYLEFVWDQAVATWLGCHSLALEWFGGVGLVSLLDTVRRLRCPS